MNIKLLEEIKNKYKQCPNCGEKTNIKIENKKIFVFCKKCNLDIILDDKGEHLLYEQEFNGNTHCMICGDKVEGGYCSCFYNRIREKI